VLVADINGDGTLDVITANNGSNDVSVLLGNGDGTFQPVTSYGVGAAPNSLAAAALTGGRLDLVTASAGSDTLSVLLPMYAVVGSHRYAAAGNYPITVTLNHDGIVSTAPSSTAQVGAPLPVSTTVTAGSSTFVYGQTNTVSATVVRSDGLVASAGTVTFQEGNTVLSGVLPIGSNGTVSFTLPTLPVGNHVITAVFSGAADFDTSVGSTSLVVTPAALTITVNNATRSYGAANPAFTVSYSGFVNGDTAGSLTTPPALTTTATVLSHVAGNPYSITASGAVDPNYTITYVAGTLTITPVPLAITADSKTKPYGAAVPALTASYSGFVNGDTAASLTTLPTLSTTATAASHVAGSPYNISASGAVDSDYTIGYVGGTLSITAVPLTITANNATRIYGVPNPTFTVSYSGFVLADGPAVLGGTLSLSTPAVASSAPGTYAITSSGLTSSDYTIAFGPGTLTVTAAPLSSTAQAITPTAGAPFSGVVATFTNADPFGGPGSYTATITWGDGQTSAGVITDAGGGIFRVSGSHTYADPNNTTFTVTISHKLGYTTSVTATGTASVTNLGLGVQEGQTGDIGFWHNSNGQALIKSFNGGSTSTALSAWLAATFPNLYGASAGGHNLTAKTNAQVAAFFLSLFNLQGPRADAQVLAVALNVYATTTSLGGTAGQAYGFTVSTTGLGARSFNVGCDGAAFGVANHTTLNVYQLLRAVNKKTVNGVLYNGDATLQAQAADLFDTLNEGDC
jgi:hypothetical protein